MSLFFHYCCLYLNRGTAKPDTRTEQLIPMDYNKHISQKKNKSTGQNQIEYANHLFLFCFCGYCFWILFSVFLFFNLWTSPYISIYHYIFVFIVILVLYMNPFRQVFFFSFEELSWEDIQRERRVIRTGWVFLISYICLARASLGTLAHCGCQW